MCAYFFLLLTTTTTTTATTNYSIWLVLFSFNNKKHCQYYESRALHHIALVVVDVFVIRVAIVDVMFSLIVKWIRSFCYSFYFSFELYCSLVTLCGWMFQVQEHDSNEEKERKANIRARAKLTSKWLSSLSICLSVSLSLFFVLFLVFVWCYIFFSRDKIESQMIFAFSYQVSDLLKPKFEKISTTTTTQNIQTNVSLFFLFFLISFSLKLNAYILHICICLLLLCCYCCCSLVRSFSLAFRAKYREGGFTLIYNIACNKIHEQKRSRRSRNTHTHEQTTTTTTKTWKSFIIIYYALVFIWKKFRFWWCCCCY